MNSSRCLLANGIMAAVVLASLGTGSGFIGVAMAGSGTPAGEYGSRRLLTLVYDGGAENGYAVFHDIHDRVEYVIPIDRRGSPPGGLFDLEGNAQGDSDPVPPGLQVKNFQSTVGSLSDLRPGCPTPVAKGPLEYLTATRILIGGRTIAVIGRSTIPAVKVGAGTSSCSGRGTTEEPVNVTTNRLKSRMPTMADPWQASATKILTLPGGGAHWRWTLGPYAE